MVRTESRYTAYHLPDRPPASSDAQASNNGSSRAEGELTRPSFAPCDAAEVAVPGWDNLWVDLGGEG